MSTVSTERIVSFTEDDMFSTYGFRIHNRAIKGAMLNHELVIHGIEVIEM